MEDTYKNYIEELFNENKDEIIACSSNDTYRDALESIFNNALFEVTWFIEDEISMENVFNRKIADAIIKFLDSGRKFNLYINKRYPDGIFGQFRYSLIDRYPNNFLYKKTSGAVNSEGKPCEYIVFDKKGYRFKPDAKKAPAIFSVNDKDFALRLSKIF